LRLTGKLTLHLYQNNIDYEVLKLFVKDLNTTLEETDYITRLDQLKEIGFDFNIYPSETKEKEKQWDEFYERLKY
jgi:hypothetical protein